MYRTIAASFWTDPKVQKLSAGTKLLFLYLITNPHTHVSGIYYLNMSYVTADLNISANTLSASLDTLSKTGICAVDTENSVVWVKKMMRYQGHGDKANRSAAAHVMEDLHHSPLITDFLEACPAVKAIVSDRVSIRYPEKVGDATPDSRSLIPTPDPEQIPKPTFRTFGEFGHVKLTEDQFQKLEMKLNGRFQYFVDRLDRWGETDPVPFRKKKSHYATILNWSTDERNASNGRESKSEALIRQQREAGERARELLRGTTGDAFGRGD